jgi:hypothetical protein
MRRARRGLASARLARDTRILDFESYSHKESFVRYRHKDMIFQWENERGFDFDTKCAIVSRDPEQPAFEPFPANSPYSMMVLESRRTVRSIAILIPVLLSADAVSSLVFVPSSCFLLSLTARGHALRPHQQPTRSGVNVFARGRRSLATLVTENPGVAAVRSDSYPIVTASEWRRLAGFQPDPPSTSTRTSDGNYDEAGAPARRQDTFNVGAIHHSQESAAEAHVIEAREIHKLQQQARAVAQKHVKAHITAQEQIQAVAAAVLTSESSSGVGSGGGSGIGSSIRLKKPLVTNVFSTPAVAHRRRSKTPSAKGTNNLQAPPPSVQTVSTETIERTATTKQTVPSEPKNTDSPLDLVQASMHPPKTSTVPVTNNVENEDEVMIAAPLKTDPPVDSNAPFPTHQQVAFSRDSDGALSAPVAPAEGTLTPTADRAPASPTSSTEAMNPASPLRRVTTLSDRVRRLRSQPKSAMVESLLQARYAAIPDVGLRAYQILRDLEMIVPTPDPNDPKYDSSRDDELAPENNYVR